MSIGATHVRVVEGLPRHRDHRLDGGNALSAAALRLSLRSRARLPAVGDLQGDGAAAAARGQFCRPGWGVRPAIIAPAMVASWALGIWLAWAGGFYAAGWLHAKLVLVIALSALHGFFVRYVREFAADGNRHSQRFYRVLNEIPTILMIGIVILAVVKPFLGRGQPLPPDA